MMEAWQVACRHSDHYGSDGLPLCRGEECKGYTVACGQGMIPCERHPIDALDVPVNCPDCGAPVCRPSIVGEDAAWKNHFEHCERHALRVEFEEPSSELTVILIKFHDAKTPNVALYARVIVNEIGHSGLSDVIKVWARADSFYIMDDWKLVSYAPIPF